MPAINRVESALIAHSELLLYLLRSRQPTMRAQCPHTGARDNGNKNSYLSCIGSYRSPRCHLGVEHVRPFHRHISLRDKSANVVYWSPLLQSRELHCVIDGGDTLCVISVTHHYHECHAIVVSLSSNSSGASHGAR